MALTKDQKKVVLGRANTILKDSETVAFVHFKGLGVADTTELRKKLTEAGVGYTVMKKTLIKKALTDAGFGETMPDLEGEVALAYGDETSPAQEVYSFSKGREENISLLGGIFEGKVVDKAGIDALAQIPSLDVLRGMFVNLINSPIQRSAIVLNEIAQTKA